MITPMGERELREKYGGKLAKAINRAIRAEVPGGNEALDRLTDLAAAAKQSHWHDKAGRPTLEAETYYKHQRDVIGRMDAQVRKTWAVPADAGRDSAAKRSPSTKRLPVARRSPSRKGKPATGKRPRKA
jgi:hypothetical protein